MDIEHRIGEIVSSWDVVNFVRNIHCRAQDFSEGNIRESIQLWDKYKLRHVFVSELEDPCHYALDDSLVEEYMTLEETTIPPIVVGYFDDNATFLTVDGNHRVATLKQRGVQQALAYVAVL